MSKRPTAKRRIRMRPRSAPFLKLLNTAGMGLAIVSILTVMFCIALEVRDYWLGH